MAFPDVNETATWFSTHITGRVPIIDDNPAPPPDDRRMVVRMLPDPVAATITPKVTWGTTLITSGDGYDWAVSVAAAVQAILYPV